MPFTTEQFLQVFADYNTAIWPTQIILVGLALVSLFYSVRSEYPATKLPPMLLAALWAWSGIAYHIVFFRRINPIAVVFGMAFVLQAVLIVVAMIRGHLRLAFRPTTVGWLGAALILYALLIYPMLGAALGHSYPNAPTFGAPCPLTIFTLGLILWNAERTPWSVVGVPILWSAVGVSAAVKLSVVEDLGLGLAGLVTLVVLVVQRVPASARPAIPAQLPDA